VVGEPCEGPFDERGDGHGLLVVVQLDVREAAVIVDNDVGELIPGASSVDGTVGGHGVAWLVEPGVALGVHVQQVSGARPLIAHHLLTLRAGGS